MINREIVYERNLTGSFMKIAAGIHAGLDEKLMLRRKLPGLLANSRTVKTTLTPRRPRWTLKNSRLLWTRWRRWRKTAAF